MPYRSIKAQNIHQSLLTHLREPSDSHFMAFTTALSEADESSLMEKSIHDDSHLIDILHLSYEIIPDNEVATKIIHSLFTSLMRRCKKLPTAKVFLLTSPNHAGFTPLHQLMISGNPEIIRVYFNEVKLVFNKGIIRPEDYRTLLIGSNQAGFTPLHSTLNSRNPKSMRAYLDEIKHALDQGVINNADWKTLLVTSNQAGFTPLHQVLKSGNHKNMLIYFDELKNAVIQGMLSLDDYRELLTKPNHAGFTPLHEAAFSGNFKITQFFFEELVRIHPKKTVYTCLMIQTKGHLPSCPPENPQANRINTYLEHKRKNSSMHGEPRPARIIHLIESDLQAPNRKRKNLEQNSVSIKHSRGQAFSCRHVFFAQPEPQRQVYYVHEGTKKLG